MAQKLGNASSLITVPTRTRQLRDVHGSEKLSCVIIPDCNFPAVKRQVQSDHTSRIVLC